MPMRDMPCQGLHTVGTSNLTPHSLTKCPIIRFENRNLCSSPACKWPLMVNATLACRRLAVFSFKPVQLYRIVPCLESASCSIEHGHANRINASIDPGQCGFTNIQFAQSCPAQFAEHVPRECMFTELSSNSPLADYSLQVSDNSAMTGQGLKAKH